MNRDYTLKLLLGGKEGIQEWNRLPLEYKVMNLAGANLAGADLEGINLEGANLTDANLYDANLAYSNLEGANLERADLSEANLSSANLSSANLSGADLKHANLHDAYLSSANLEGANLERADLSEVNLEGANLADANLTDANLADANLNGANPEEANLEGANLEDTHLKDIHLNGINLNGANLEKANLINTVVEASNAKNARFSNANLSRSRFIRVDLSEAIFENAIVQDIHLEELQGLPQPPTILRKGVDESYVLTGEPAAQFFVLPAIVEVYLDRKLTDQELGLFQFHLGEVHFKQVALDVFLVGHRFEGEGSVLRFQGKTYEGVYSVLPDLLAPFRFSTAVDWEATLNSLPKEKRAEAINALVKSESRLVKDRWHLAQKLALTFDTFSTAQIKWLGDDRTKGVRIEVFIDKKSMEEFSNSSTPLSSSSLTFNVASGGKGVVVYDPKGSLELNQGATKVGDKFDISGNVQGSAIGRGASVTADSIISNIQESIPDEDLKGVLVKALEQLKRESIPEPEKEKVANQVKVIADEMKESKPDPGVISRFLSKIANICKPVADILGSAKSIIHVLK